jgi:hypothetical protein
VNSFSEQVVVKPRKQWQLDRWAEAVWERSKIED